MSSANTCFRAGAGPGASRMVAGVLGTIAGEEPVTPNALSACPGATSPESGHGLRTHPARRIPGPLARQRMIPAPLEPPSAPHPGQGSVGSPPSFSRVRTLRVRMLPAIPTPSWRRAPRLPPRAQCAPYARPTPHLRRIHTTAQLDGTLERLHADLEHLQGETTGAKRSTNSASPSAPAAASVCTRWGSARSSGVSRIM